MQQEHHEPLFEEVAEGIYCIETGLYRPGLAACYLVCGGDRLAFIDTGTAHTVPRLLATLDRLGYTPAQVAYVMPTHVHLDHAGGAGALMAHCPNARLVTHPRGVPHLIDPTKLIAGATAVYGAESCAQHFGTLTPVPATRVVAAQDGERFLLGERGLRFLDTPGHANHHGCFLDELTRGCFAGDTFGIAYRALRVGDTPWLFAPTTPVAFDPERWQQSLDRLMTWDPQAMYLTHYGRLDQPAAHVAALRASIAALAAGALRHETEPPGPERLARLRDTTAAVLLAAAREHGIMLDATRWRALLVVDLELNARGLDVWLQRRAAAAAGNSS